MTDHNPDNTNSFESEESATSPNEGYEPSRPPRRDRDHERRPRFGGGRSDRRPQRGERRRSYDRPQEVEVDPHIAALIRETEEKLTSALHPVQIENLNPFERKQFHQHFERRKSVYQTKTYRNEENHVLWVFPVANLRKFLETKAQEVRASGEAATLPAMSNYERFLAHNILKEFGTVESFSAGEGEERHIVIKPKELSSVEPAASAEAEASNEVSEPNKFGRSLRKIAKKIKLM